MGQKIIIIGCSQSWCGNLFPRTSLLPFPGNEVGHMHLAAASVSRRVLWLFRVLIALFREAVLYKFYKLFCKESAGEAELVM